MALVVGRAEEARVTGAFRDVARVICTPSITRFRQIARAEMHNLIGIIVEAHDEAGLSTMPAIARVRSMLPRVPLIGYCRRQGPASQEVIAFVRAGVDELVFQGLDDVGAGLRRALLSAEQSSAATLVMASLQPLLPPEIIPLVDYCLTFGRRPISVADAATALGVHRKTLVNQCMRAKLPPPNFIIGWCRIFLAAALLEQDGYTVEHVAHVLDFPSAVSLRNAFRRYVGKSPIELRNSGGLAAALQRFMEVAACHEHSEVVPRRSRDVVQPPPFIPDRHLSELSPAPAP